MRPDPPDTSKLPSLSALRTFEVSARGYSLTEAAHHLHVTVGAVSRQIKMLEDELGVKLFDRKANSLSLNETGRQLARDLSRAFAMILAATNRARHQYKTEIRLTCTLSIASHWLNKRIAKLTADAGNGIALAIDPSADVRDLDTGEADLAIRYCPTSLPRLNARPLFAEHFLPVCPPQYLRELGGVSTPDDLLRARLIHAPWFLNNHHENSSWDDWFAIAGGGASRKALPVLSFTGVGYAVDEILANGGVIIGSSAIIADDLADGRLVPVFDDRYRIASPYEYRLVWAPSATNSPEVRQLIDAILALAGHAPEFER
ncbi:LysR family transcriptional regulator [Burkholderia sp. ABCPW 14]|uniref:LysR substrate-binding domain-containing protein n=1 Tax=Burkholderia sp. ABCPW 14 TaxID=1637860 RepID=UPI000770DEA3|nr:LysR substrate-binding domain-containing protein [Burkholderia sp. ABCPW 14]KVD74864.1 LysR family transcriptional regulator [Burkholderia sp. ABCPW 14]